LPKDVRNQAFGKPNLYGGGKVIRKIGSIVLMMIGIVVFVAATVSIISTRLSLPPWSVETEGRWTAYGLQVWGYFAGELPLSLILLLIGVFLWPSRPRSLMTKGLGVIALIITLVGLAGLARMVYSWVGIELSPSLRDVFLGIVVNFAPLLAITILAAVAARKFLISRA
jgi:hypothetical protein